MCLEAGIQIQHLFASPVFFPLQSSRLDGERCHRGGHMGTTLQSRNVSSSDARKGTLEDDPGPPALERAPLPGEGGGTGPLKLPCVRG